jgi:UDPglucose 6-dehydrogenase
VDINAEAVRKINAGRPPVDEPLLAETMAKAGRRLRATTDPTEAVTTDASFFIVPSPSLPDGSFSNEFLMRALSPIAQAVRRAKKKNHIFVISSTTTPGACRGVIIPMSGTSTRTSTRRSCVPRPFGSSWSASSSSACPSAT